MSYVNKPTSTGSISKTPFPSKLLEILETAPTSIITWADHGLSFFVRDQALLVEQIFPLYFRQHKFSSFKRQLNLYGFRYMTKGPDSGAYFHPLFRRDRPDLVRFVVRVPKNCQEHAMRSNALANHLKTRKPGESVNYDMPSLPTNNFQRNRKLSKISKVMQPSIFSNPTFSLDSLADDAFYTDSIGSPTSSTDSEFESLKNQTFSFSGPPSPIPLYNESSVFDLKDDIFELKDCFFELFQLNKFQNSNLSYEGNFSPKCSGQRDENINNSIEHQFANEPSTDNKISSVKQEVVETSDLSELIDLDFKRNI